MGMCANEQNKSEGSWDFFVKLACNYTDLLFHHHITHNDHINKYIWTLALAGPLKNGFFSSIFIAQCTNMIPLLMSKSNIRLANLFVFAIV